MKLKLNPTALFSVSAFILAATGCVTTTDPLPEAEGDGDTTTAQGDGDSGDGDAPAATGGAGTGGTTAMGDGDLYDGTCPVEPCPTTGTGGAMAKEPLPVEVYLPVTVSDVFAPSGFMGQLNTDAGEPDEVEGILMDETGCPAEDRPEGAAGECFAVSYQPQYLTPCSDAQIALDPECGGATWAGVFFQNPSLNWGEQAGVVIEQGATKIVFTAWTAEGQGEVELNFLAGGIGTLGTAYADTFKVESSFTVSETPTQYELNIAGATYEMVLGGFGWTIAVESLDEVNFYLDDMRWIAD